MKFLTPFITTLIFAGATSAYAAEGSITVNLFIGVEQDKELNETPGARAVRVQILKSEEVRLKSGYGYQPQSVLLEKVEALAPYRQNPFSHVYIGLPAYCTRSQDHAMISVFASEAERAEYIQAHKDGRPSHASALTHTTYYGNGSGEVDREVCRSL